MTEQEFRDRIEQVVRRCVEKMHGLAIESTNDYFKRQERIGDRNFLRERAHIITDTVNELEIFVRREIKIFDV